MEPVSIVVEYQLTWNEWRKIFWGASAKKVISAFAMFFAFFFVVSALVFNGDGRLWALVISILGLVSVASNFWIAPRRYWNSASSVREAKHVEISDEGIVLTSASLEERLAWDHFRSVKDAKRYVILNGRAGSAMIFLPKRGLLETQDETALLQLILRHIPYA